MIISDLVALARAGYTPAQVKEILAMQTSETEGKTEEAPEIPPKEEAQPEEQKKEPEVKADESKNKEQNEEIARLQKELEKVKADLLKAQNMNTRQNNAGDEKSKDEVLNDIVRSFM